MGSPKKRLQYHYDSRGNRRALVDQDGGRFTYTYDSVNRITQVINPQGDRTSYSYDAAGRRTLKRMANGTRASFSYDPAGNLTGLYNLKSNGDVISSFDYQYDRVGNRTAVLEADGSRVTWSYDATYQLTGEHRTGTTPYEDTYSYDQVGNRLTKVHDGARTTYSYDAANQLEWSEDASGRTTFTFDADGNQQVTLEPTGDRTTNTWDYENRMTHVKLPSGIRNTMAYEPGGLRVKLEESTGTTKFVWDGQNYLAETDETDDTQVVYTNEPRLYGNLVSERRTGDTSYYHFDCIGSTREVTSTSGDTTDTRLYNAFGVIVHSTGATPIPLGYVGAAGYFTDLDTNAVYVRARILAPPLGRWSSMDPIGASHLGNYQYVDNDPSNAIDPSGLVPDRCIEDCENDCYRRYPRWWDPRYIVCIHACPVVCADPQMGIPEAAWRTDLDIFCQGVNDPNILGGNVATCLCAVAGVADLLPVWPPGWDYTVETIDCVCNLLTTAQQFCKGNKWGGAGYAAITAVDCASLPLGEILGCLIGAKIGTFFGPGAGNVSGCVVGLIGGKVVLDPVLDVAAFLVQNRITQGTILPVDQVEACCDVLGIQL